MSSALPSVPINFQREQKLVRLLMSYIATGLFFMVLPGTFLGVWNLFSISGGHSATSVSDAWIQAHGHAQVFGWVGTFILGISFYTLPNLRRLASFNWIEGWATLILWALGVALRWLCGVYSLEWWLLLPLSAALELVAFAIFAVLAVRAHWWQWKLNKTLDAFSIFFLCGIMGFGLTLGITCFEAFQLPFTAVAPVVPSEIDKMLVVVETWGLAVPVAWAFSLKWMPVFLALEKANTRLLIAGAALNTLGVLCVFINQFVLAAILLTLASVTVIAGLHIWVPGKQPAKTAGVHASFPLFVRLAYGWLVIADLLGIIAAAHSEASGFTGAARHALTVGFLATMIFSVAPRMLPAFLGRKGLYSANLMFWALAILTGGCTLRVVSEMIAYQQHTGWAWIVLPISATLELTAVVIFAINIGKTLTGPPLLTQAGNGGCARTHIEKGQQ